MGVRILFLVIWLIGTAGVFGSNAILLRIEEYKND
jgi:hypothetical protein